jgi:hypothetical protein
MDEDGLDSKRVIVVGVRVKGVLDVGDSGDVRV